MSPYTSQLPARRVFGIPIYLTVSSLIGLLSALLGDGVWDLLSWIALGAPVAVILAHAGGPWTRRG